MARRSWADDPEHRTFQSYRMSCMASGLRRLSATSIVDREGTYRVFRPHPTTVFLIHEDRGLVLGDSDYGRQRLKAAFTEGEWDGRTVKVSQGSQGIRISMTSITRDEYCDGHHGSTGTNPEYQVMRLAPDMFVMTESWEPVMRHLEIDDGLRCVIDFEAKD